MPGREGCRVQVDRRAARCAHCVEQDHVIVRQEADLDQAQDQYDEDWRGKGHLDQALAAFPARLTVEDACNLSKSLKSLPHNYSGYYSGGKLAWAPRRPSVSNVMTGKLLPELSNRPTISLAYPF